MELGSLAACGPISPASLFSPPHALSSPFLLLPVPASLWLPVPRHSHPSGHPTPPPPPPGLPSHLSVCSSLPVPLSQVSRIAAYAYSALSQIRVDAKEELVVQFGIP